jgi:microcystin-dependent protein
MAALNFPTSPVNNQEFDNWIYSTSKGAWQAMPTPFGGLPAGSIIQWSTNTAPKNWLIADGAVLSRSTYASLFAIIGTTYGVGDGSTTFALPDLRGRVPVGKAGTGGAETHTLTEAQMPVHTHTQDSHNHTQDAHRHTMLGDVNNAAPSINASEFSLGPAQAASKNLNTGYTTATNQAATATNQNAGSGQAHNNLQPYIVLNYIIKTSSGFSAGDSELATRLGVVENGKANLVGGNTLTGQQHVSSSSPSSTPLVVKGSASQTANLTQWQDSSGGAVASISPSGIVSATNYNVTVNTFTTASLALDFSGGSGIDYQPDVSLNTTFTGTGYQVGATKTVVLKASATKTLTFPTGWTFVGTKPTSISAGAAGILTVISLGTTESNCIAGWVS